MRAIFLGFINCEGQIHKTVSTDHNFWRERTAEAESNRGLSAYQPNALLNTKTFKRTLIYYGADIQYANIWEIPFVKPQNDIKTTDKRLKTMKNERATSFFWLSCCCLFSA